MKRTIWAGILSLCLAAPAMAAERVEDTVVVTASRIEESAKTVPQSLTIIDSETLAKNQYESLADLLQNYGFSIMSYGPSQTSTQISIRGFSSNFSNPFDSNVLVLVNGAPIATTNLSMIPMDGIEQIEVLRGPGAVQYGSSAVGGVINIIPKRGGKEFHLSAEAGGGTWNSYRALGGLSGEFNVFDFAGSVTWNKQGDNYTTGDGKLYQDTHANSRLGYLLNFGLNFNEENRLGAVIMGANDWGLGLNNSLEREEKYNGLDATASRINSSGDVTYDGGYSPAGLSWKLRYFTAYDQYDTRYAPDNPTFLSDNSIYVSQSGGQGQLSWNWNWLTLTGGVDYTTSEYSSGFAPSYQQDDTALFALAKLNFFDDMLVLTGGIRYDAYTFKVDGDSQDMDNTSFSAGLAFNPYDWLTLKASFGESYKVPSGLYVVGYEGAGGVEGNPSLEPEKGYGWDTGIDIHWRGLNLGLSYFSTLYENKFLFEMVPSGKYRYYNADGSSWFSGVEGQISFDLGEFFEWDFVLRPYFNFTRMLTYQDADGNKVYNTRDFVAGYGVNFNYPEYGTDVDVRLNYIGYQEEQIFDDSGRLPDKRTGGDTTVDIFISQTVYDFGDGGKLSLKGEVRNLTNTNYAYRYDYPMPGRSFYVGIRYDF